MVKSPPATWETWVRSLGWEDTLEKGMATHSSILVWRIPWTEEPSKLQSMGSQRVGRGLAIKQQQSLEISGVLGLFVCLSFPFVLNEMGVIKFTSALF